MRVLVISHEFPPVGGGGGHIARDLCQSLAGRDHEVKVLTADLIGGVTVKEAPSYNVTRVPTLRKDPSRASLLAMITFVISALFKVLFLVSNWRPALIHVHFAVPSGPIAWVFSKLFGIPYVITAHLGDVPGGTPKKTDTWFRFFYPFTIPVWNGAASVVAVSEFTKNLALNHYDVPVEVIHNGVDVEVYRRRESQVHDPPRLVFAGRFVPQKNPLGILRVMESLRDLEWEFVMLGDGPLFQEARQRIQSSGLEDRFRTPGWVSPEEVRDTFCRSDILFMPSHTEGLPIVGVQALAAGLAFIVSDIGGFIDLVQNGVNGYRIALDDDFHAAFSESLSEILVDREQLQAFKIASRKMAEKFDIAFITDEYERLFTRVMGRN